MEQQKTYLRKDRSVSPETRHKIRNALKNRPKSDEHKQHISNALKADTGGYWSKIPVHYDDGQTGYVERGDIV